MSDLINRQAAIDAFLTELTRRERNNLLHTWSTVEVKYFITKMLEDLPSVQPERKTGRWILWNYPEEECAICSACGKEYDQMELYIGGNDYPKYCPDCGAKMEDEDE